MVNDKSNTSVPFLIPDRLKNSVFVRIERIAEHAKHVGVRRKSEAA
jgi:hypothetical protein